MTPPTEPGAAYVDGQYYEPTLIQGVWIYNLPSAEGVLFQADWTESIHDGNIVNMTGSVSEATGRVYADYELIDPERLGQVTIYGLPWGTSELYVAPE